MPQAIRSRPFAKSSLFAALALLAAPAFAQNLSLLDARVVEGTGGTSMLVFEARLSAPTSGPVSFAFATSDASAVASSDYTQLPPVGLLIPAGQTSLAISVPVTSDADIEPNEYLVATISNVVGASLGRATGRGLIVNDDNKMLVTAPHDPLDQQAGARNSASDTSAMSSDGRYVAFVSSGVDYIAIWPGTYPYTKRIWVRDNRTGVTTLASVAAGGGDSNGDSINPAISADGRYVVFESQASNLVSGDDNLSADVFRRDLLTGTTELVSVNYAGIVPANGWSTKPSVSADGRHVAFQSVADDVVADDGNTHADAFVRDMQAGTTVQANPVEFQGAYGPRISADGRYVVYDRGAMEPWRRDLQTGEQLPVATGVGGMAPNSTSYNYGISADGRYVVFASWATNLVADGAGSPAIYVSDVQTGTTVLASRGSNGVSVGNAWTPSMSGDGRYVAFTTVATAAGEPVDDGTPDVYLRDLQANTTIRVSENYLGGVDSGGENENPSISPDGRVVSFLSNSPTMLPGDNNARADVFRVVLPQDSSLPSLSLQDMWVTEGDAGTKLLYFDVGLSAPATAPVTFDFATADGTAVAGGDYGPYSLVAQSIPAGQSSISFAIEIVGDLTPEADEAFNIYVGNVSGARLLDGHALAIIGNNDASPSGYLSIGDVTISEGNDGIQVATFTISLSAASTTDVSFDIATADDSAVAGSDYMANAQTGLTIPAGSTSATFNVGITGDGVVEPNETFLVQLSNPIGATVADGQGVGTISNDDAYPTISVSDVTLSEGNAGTQQAIFTLTLSAPAASPVSYNIATHVGTAIDGMDYNGRSLIGQVIPVGASTASFAVTIKGDAVVEANESFEVNLSSVVGATVVDGQGIGTIVNDDVLPSLSIADATIAEGNSGTRVATFTVQLSAPAAEPVYYSFDTASGTAVAPSDFALSGGSGQIPVGYSAMNLSVTIYGDTAIEADETFFVNVSGVSGAIVTDGQAIGTISNDDFLPSLSIADLSIAEGNNGSKLATFTVTLSAASSSAVAFTAATANGTAVAPGDYTAKAPTSLAISPGALSKTFTVSIKGDKAVEANESFYVVLSNPSGATLADGQAVGTIVNDDAPKFSLSRVTTGGLYDDIDDRRGDPVLSPSEYASLLLDSAQQVCARAGGATIVGVDGVESLAVLADLADTANGLCPRRPRYSAALKANGLGFLVDGVANKAKGHGTQVLELAGTSARATSLTVLAEGHERPLTVLLAATPSTIARERADQAGELNRLVRTRLSADPRARIVVLGPAGLSGLVDLTARSLPAATGDVERIWVSPAVLEEFERAQLDIPGTPKPKTAQQVLQLQP